VVYAGACGTPACGPKTFPKSSSRILFKVVSSSAWLIATRTPCARRSTRIGAKMLAAQSAKDSAGALPDDLNQMLRAYMESRAMLTALELDIFTAVGAGSTCDEVARKVSTHPRATEMLLNALAAMGLLFKQRGGFRNTPTTVRYFAEGSKDNARPACSTSPLSGIVGRH